MTTVSTSRSNNIRGEMEPLDVFYYYYYVFHFVEVKITTYKFPVGLLYVTRKCKSLNY